ncbi:MAG: copper amine oxidase N-terminal domain-containing protein [Oscillospiraceae bacterium]|nr:copper amine oxidase N-terminal domain-containing protein [Oscillospiraceae bacterium]
MKKIIACLLAIVLAVALVCPAAVAAERDPLWKLWGYESLEECLADDWMSPYEYFMITLDYALYYRDEIPVVWEVFGYESIEELLDSGLVTAADYFAIAESLAFYTDEEVPLIWELFGCEDLREFIDAGWMTAGEYYLMVVERDRDYYRIVEPEPIWEVFGYDSLEEFLADGWMTQEEYEAVLEKLEIANAKWDAYVEEWLAYEAEWQQYLEESRIRTEEMRAKEIETLGGKRGIINVMYNGEFIKFDEAEPEIVNGSTFVPAKLVFEAMGAEVGFDSESKTVTVDMDDCSIRLVLGQKTLTITENGETDELTLSEAPYAKNGSSYVPARAIAEILDLDVYWDSDYRSVVIVDTKQLIADIDKDFTVFNKVFGMQLGAELDEGSAFVTTADIAAIITMFNTLDGDTNVELGANIILHSDGRNMRLKGAVDLSGLISLILTDDMYDYYYEDEIEEMERVFGALEDATVDIIFNYDEDIIYIKAPILHVFEEEIPADAWISMSGISEELEYMGLSDVGDALNTENILGGMSIGESIYLDNEFNQYYRQIYLYDNVTTAAEETKLLLGDDNFKKVGDDYVLSLKYEEMVDDPDFGEFLYYMDISEFDMQFVIHTDGDVVTGLSGDLLFRERPYGYGYGYMPGVLDLLSGMGGYSDTRYVIKLEITAGKIYLYYEMHEKNSAIMQIEIDISTDATSEPVPSGPPAGEKVVPLEELFPDEFGRPSLVTPF